MILLTIYPSPSLKLPTQPQSRRGIASFRGVFVHLPSNLSDNLTHKGGTLAEVTFALADTGLQGTSCGFLHVSKEKKSASQRPSSAFETCVFFRPHRGRERPLPHVAAEILHEVRL